jgi:hypothetical protein
MLPCRQARTSDNQVVDVMDGASPDLKECRVSHSHEIVDTQVLAAASDSEQRVAIIRDMRKCLED